MFASSKVRQLALIAPTIIFYLSSPVIIILRIASDPATWFNKSAFEVTYVNTISVGQDITIPALIAMAPDSALTPTT